jgi:hypothetical protein
MRKWEDRIEMDLREIIYEWVNWIELAQDTVYTVTSFLDP